MSLLVVSEVSKSFGSRKVLEKVSLQLQPGEKAGLIGPNGAGKSTLLQIIAGRLEAENGSVALARGTKTGYLPQERSAAGKTTLRHFLEGPFLSLIKLQETIASLEREIAARSHMEGADLQQLLENYGEQRRRFEDGGGYLMESRISAVAGGLGFSGEDLDRPMAQFSGGEKSRAALAALLLNNPDLLLLDEPTNYLDFGGLAWLESHLTDSRSSMLIVSHDRYFLDAVVTRIFAMDRTGLSAYRGNYSSYRKMHDAAQSSRERAYLEQQQLIEHTARQIRRSKADRRSKRQARSRQKALDRLEVLKRPGEEKRFHLDFDYAGRSGRQVITFDGVSKSFGERKLFENLNFQVLWGDRLALLGPNGSGKSTLLKMIAGEEAPCSGRIGTGPSVGLVYFAQEQEPLHPGRTVLEEITASSDLDLKQARNHLGRYLFRGDDVFKKAASLSGGEKSRLALARLSLHSGNCLLMDEPTSHLDLPALEELETVLGAYPGTMIIVSHDRYFLNNLVNRVFEIREGALHIFEGNFQEYLESREKENPAADSGKEKVKMQKQQGQAEQRRQRELERRRRRLQEEQAGLEDEIHVAEADVARYERILSDPEEYGDFNRLRLLNDELTELKERLSELLRRWEQVSRSLERVAGPDR